MAPGAGRAAEDPVPDDPAPPATHRVRLGARAPAGAGRVSEGRAAAAVGSAELPAPTPALRLVEKFAHHRRDAAAWGWGIFGTGAREPIVRIHHGSVPIFVRDLGKCLMVVGVIDVPPEVREKLAKASGAEQEAFLSGLREELMQCPRVGFAFAPGPLRGAETLERIALDQTFQVAENDASSFNRFCDAIQETETILLRAAEYLRRFLVRSAETEVYSTNSSPPTSLYL